MSVRLLRSLVAAALVVAATPLRAQTNVDSGSILTMTAQAAGQVASSDQSNVSSNSLKCVANLTTVSGGYVQLALQGRDRGSGQYFNIFTTPAVAGGVFTFTIGRGLVPGLASGQWVVNDVVPATWRVVANVLGTPSTSVTGTVGCSLIN